MNTKYREVVSKGIVVVLKVNDLSVLKQVVISVKNSMAAEPVVENGALLTSKTKGHRKTAWGFKISVFDSDTELYMKKEHRKNVGGPVWEIQNNWGLAQWFVMWYYEAC